MLTSADVEQKTFSTALRGYDLDEVDDFLDEVASTIRGLNEKLTAAEAAAAAPPPLPSISEAPAPKHVDVDESAISRALIAAQEAADKLLDDAKSEAVKIVDDAKSEADTWQAEREAKRKEAQDEISALAQRVASVRTELSVLAGEVSGKLDEMDHVIESSETASEVGEEDADEHAVYTSKSEDGKETSGAAEARTDDLDDILNDVASDLQLDTSDEDDAEEHGDSDDSEDSNDSP